MELIRILIVDPDIQTRNLIREMLSDAHFAMDEAIDGITAIKLFRRQNYQLVLLNMILPELDGRNAFIQIRQLSDVPIFILCDDPSDEKCIAAFALGADEYIPKPFHPKALFSRIKVFLRRNGVLEKDHDKRVFYKGLYIDIAAHAVSVDELVVSLTPKKYALLAFLSQNPNRAFSRDALLNEVWGSDFFGSERTVDTHIKSLRKSIQPYGHYLVTIWGYGYKFEANATPEKI